MKSLRTLLCLASFACIIFWDPCLLLSVQQFIVFKIQSILDGMANPQLFIFSFVDEYLSWFQFLATINKATINFFVQDFGWIYFHPFLVNTKSWNSRVYGSCLFNFIRSLLSVLQVLDKFTFPKAVYGSNLNSHQHCFCQSFLFFILLGLKWYYIMILICIFLMTNNYEHLLKCLLPIYIFWFKISFKIFWAF